MVIKTGARAAIVAAIIMAFAPAVERAIHVRYANHDHPHHDSIEHRSDAPAIAEVRPEAQLPPYRAPQVFPDRQEADTLSRAMVTRGMLVTILG
jgi:hypothetical protein